MACAVLVSIGVGILFLAVISGTPIRESEWAGSLALAVVGLLLCGTGALGWSGRLLRGSPRMRGTAYASGLWSGVSFLLLAVTGLPPLRESMWGVVFALPWLGFLCLSLCCYYSHRPPAWALPPWQRKYIRPHRAKPGPGGDERR